MIAFSQTLTPSNPTQSAITVSVWVRDTRALSLKEIQTASQTLSVSEIDRASRFRLPELRRDYIAAHDLVRRALTAHDSRYAAHSWKFVSGVHGKPFLEIDEGRTGIEFSLTHTSGLVACAVSTAPVGIDVELVRPDWDYREVVRYFTAAEAKALSLVSPELSSTTFVEIWTLKESFLKAVGCGLSGALDSVSFDVADTSRVQCSLPDNFTSNEWKFQLLSPSPDSRLAITLNSSLPMDLRVVAV